MKQLIHVPNIILGAFDEDDDYDGDAKMITIKIMNVEYIYG